jgi:very-short-patch-repair endonuclease
MERRPFDADRVMLELARLQHGVASSSQLRRAGVSHDIVERRVRAGLLKRMFHGVYLVGPVTVPRAREMAALLACGDNAVISQQTAAAVWEIMPPQGLTEPVYVISAHSDHGRRRHICARRISTLRADEVTMRDGIRLTTVERTLMDLAAVATTREVERALAEAYARRLTTRAAILALLARHAGRPGVRQLQSLVTGAPPALTKSEAEERLLTYVRRVGLPAPRVNVRVHGYEVDFYWPRHRFVVEVDGFAYHSSAARFEGDRRRDSVLAAAGIQVMRVTWRQLNEEHETMLVRLAQALALAARSP